MRSNAPSLRNIALAALSFIAAAFGSPANADVVTDWNATAQAAIVATPGTQYAVILALTHAAIYDAVNSIDGRYSVYAVSPTSSTRGASKEAAAAAAAYRALAALFPAQRPALDTAYAASLAAIPDGPAESKGVTIGQEVAAAWLAARADDGRSAVVPYVFNAGPGVYQATPPALASPLTPWLAKMRPFALERASQFRAYGPPNITSTRFAEDLNDVKTLGAIDSTERTAEETELALFHTENPATFWARNVRSLAIAKKLSVTDNARLFAMVFITHADAIIACWDSKYYFNSWRPVTAIRAAATDDNPATAQDAAWAPLANTPPHPEYPAAHACGAASFAVALNEFFATKWVKFTMTSTVAATVPHAFYNTDGLVEEIKLARIFGGMHFPTAVDHGAILGRNVARFILRNEFKPLRRR